MEIHPILKKLYLKNTKFWKYALICGLGIIVNQVFIHLFIRFLPLWIANLFAIIIAWLWNYTNTLGFLSKYWGMT